MSTGLKTKSNEIKFVGKPNLASIHCLKLNGRIFSLVDRSRGMNTSFVTLSLFTLSEWSSQLLFRHRFGSVIPSRTMSTCEMPSNIPNNGPFGPLTWYVGKSCFSSDVATEFLLFDQKIRTDAPFDLHLNNLWLNRLQVLDRFAQAARKVSRCADLSDPSS